LRPYICIIVKDDVSTMYESNAGTGTPVFLTGKKIAPHPRPGARKPKTEEHRRRISEAMKGRKPAVPNAAARAKMAEAARNKVYTPEECAKRSKNAKRLWADRKAKGLNAW